MSGTAYVEGARYLAALYKSKKYSERELAKQEGLSKSEVHRMIVIGNLPEEWLTAAETYSVEKYVLVLLSELGEIPRAPLAAALIAGELRYYKQVKHLKPKPKRIAKASLKARLAHAEWILRKVVDGVNAWQDSHNYLRKYQ